MFYVREHGAPKYLATDKVDRDVVTVMVGYLLMNTLLTRPAVQVSNK